MKNFTSAFHYIKVGDYIKCTLEAKAKEKEKHTHTHTPNSSKANEQAKGLKQQ